LGAIVVQRDGRVAACTEEAEIRADLDLLGALGTQIRLRLGEALQDSALAALVDEERRAPAGIEDEVADQEYLIRGVHRRLRARLTVRRAELGEGEEAGSALALVDERVRR